MRETAVLGVVASLLLACAPTEVAVENDMTLTGLTEYGHGTVEVDVEGIAVGELEVGDVAFGETSSYQEISPGETEITFERTVRRTIMSNVTYTNVISSSNAESDALYDEPIRIGRRMRNLVTLGIDGVTVDAEPASGW